MKIEPQFTDVSFVRPICIGYDVDHEGRERPIVAWQGQKYIFEGEEAAKTFMQDVTTASSPTS